MHTSNTQTSMWAGRRGPAAAVAALLPSGLHLLIDQIFMQSMGYCDLCSQLGISAHTAAWEMLAASGVGCANAPSPATIGLAAGLINVMKRAILLHHYTGRQGGQQHVVYITWSMPACTGWNLYALMYH
eukprot:GHRR01036300.1.p1 GENE.GHRR01036300.1~~GHRR01036300.1.p1  ORF type:complete len:129 (-),score=26.23 GHRR01036300.1:152-538(-)